MTTLEPAEQIAVTEPVVAAASGVGESVAASAGFYVRERVTEAEVRQSVAGLSSAASGFVDAVSRLVSLLPGGPFSEVLAGALQLVRRGLFNQAPTAAPRVLVGEVLRPMTGEDWAFSTSLEGAVAGSLGAVDPEGAPLSYTLSRAPQFGTVRIDPDGSWVYTPGDGAGDQADEFAVTVADGGWNILDPFAAPTEVTVGVHAVSSSNKRGLIASDWLEIVKTTGEFFSGDDPVMMTVVLTTTLGEPDSTSVRMVDEYVNEIAGGLKVGDKVNIPDQDGDLWLNYSDKFKPLELRTVLDSYLDSTKPLKIPLVISLTMMFEGDSSLEVIYYNMYKSFLESQLRTIGQELEKTEIKVEMKDGAVNTEALKQAMGQAQDRIFKSVETGTPLIIAGAIERIKQWAFSVGDPDDPVGVGINALIPMDISMAEKTSFFEPPVSLIELLKERRSCPEAVSCNVAAIEVTSGGYDYDSFAPPAVEIKPVDGKGSGATARVVLAPHPVEPELENVVAQVEVTNPGSGYVSPPQIGFVSDYGTGAEARAVLGGGIMLDDQYLGLFTKEVRNPVFDTNIPIRYGFLLPPEAVNRKWQQWETTYAGDYLDNDWAEWKVETKGWSRINW